MNISIDVGGLKDLIRGEASNHINERDQIMSESKTNAARALKNEADFQRFWQSKQVYIAHNHMLEEPGILEFTASDIKELLYDAWVESRECHNV